MRMRSQSPTNPGRALFDLQVINYAMHKLPNEAVSAGEQIEWFAMQTSHR